MKCRICSKPSLGDYCEAHEEARERIYEKYEAWKRAMGVSWKQYLKEIVNNPLTGTWAKEVAEDLIKKEGNQDDEKG